jgi:hypothetical protein
MVVDAVDKSSIATSVIIDNNAENNNENNVIKKRDVVLKKPQASLLTAYNQTWKPAPNHFVRYSDVRVREDRRTNVMDLANQPKVSQRINGWKTHLISAEIDEVVSFCFSCMLLLLRPNNETRVIGKCTFSILFLFLFSAFYLMQINDETHEMEILTSVLKRLEAKESGAEAEKINELIKVRDFSSFVVDNFLLTFSFYSDIIRAICNAVGS